MAKKNTPIKAAIWSILERASTQLVGLCIGIVLARLLTPHDYGIVGMASIFLTLSGIFVDSGFGNALIRKPDKTEDDLSTAFVFNMIVGIVVYSLLFLCAPLIASFFNEPQLMWLIRVIGIMIILNSLCLVQIAILTAKLNIRIQTLINLFSQIPAGIIAILLAYYGAGIYALALQQIIAGIIKVFALWHFADWKLNIGFSKKSFKYLWGFGSKLTGATLIGVFFSESYSLLIGKFIGTNQLGYYSKASHLNSNFNSVGVGVIQKIALPILSQDQNNKVLLAENFREVMRILVLVISPFSVFLFFYSKDIITIIWGIKWIDSAVIFQLLIIGGLFVPISTLSLILLQVVNKTGLILKLEFPKKFLYVIIIFIGFQYGLIGLCYAQIFINILACVINMWFTRSILDYSYFSQMLDVIKYIFLAFVVGLPVFVIFNFNVLLINIITGFLAIMSLYALLLYITRDSVYLKYISRVRILVK